MIKHTFPDKLGILKASKNNCNSLKALIVGSPLLLLKGVVAGGGRTFLKLRGEPKILLERGDNLEKNGIDIEMRGGEVLLFNYFTIQLHLLCVQRKK